MKIKNRAIAYLMLFGLFLLLISSTGLDAAAGELASVNASKPAGVGFGVMPPHPDLLERANRGEVDLPAAVTDPELQRTMGLNQPGELIQPSGTWRAIALLVQFSDNAASTSATYFDTMLFDNSAGTMRDYYQEVSYGILDIVTVNLPSSTGWMTMPQTYAYYVAGNNGFGTYPNNAQKLAEDAVLAANPVVDFSQYDNDSDGYVDSLFVIHAGQGAEYTGNPNHIWSHKWSMVSDPFLDGVTLNTYTMEPEYWASPGDMTIGVYAHELAHAFGLPDLYDTDGTAQGIGRWGLMAGGSWNGTLGNSPAWFSAWSRLFLGFSTPTYVVGNVTGISIPAAENSQTVYRLWTDGAAGDEYFLVENRQPIGYDAALPGFGLMVWHIDDSKSGNQLECDQVNNWICGANHLKVALEQADGLFDLEHNSDGGDTGDTFPGSTGNTNFNFGTVPNSSSYGHSNDTCVGVNNIGPSGATMTADLYVSCGVVEGGIGLISDRSELVAITPILDEMGFSYGILNNNWNGSQGIYTSDPDVLASFDVVVWYASGDVVGRLTTPEEQAALEAYLQSGGRLLVTGYDTLGSPTDPLLAELIRSSSSGDGPFTFDYTITNGSHPITNGPFGHLPTGTALTAAHSDHDQAEANTGLGAVTVAELSDGHDKIMATELSGGGIVVYWNGNRAASDWTGFAASPQYVMSPSAELSLQQYEASPEANYDGAFPVWQMPSYISQPENKTPMAQEGIVFPATGDTVSVVNNPYWFNAGDYVEGVRTLSLGSVSNVKFDLSMPYNSLYGTGHVDLDLSINGIVVGSFTVYPGESYRSISFTFPPISGPNYTIRLEETNTVEEGYGSIQIPLDTSTLTFSNASTAENVAMLQNTLHWLTLQESEIELLTPTFSFVVPAGGTDSDTLSFENIGIAPLNWSANWFTGAVDVVDDWTLYFDWGCTGSPGTAVITFHPDYTFTENYGGSGTWTLTDNNLVFTYPSGTEYSGYVAGDHIAGTSFAGEMHGCWEAERVVSPVVSMVFAEMTPSGSPAAEPGAETEFVSLAADYEALPGSPWLEVTPASGALPPASTQNSLVSVDANVYVPGEYGLIVLHSDDSDEALLAIPVTMEVMVVDQPDIEVSPTSLASTQPPDTVQVLPLAIQNVGTANLVWDIYESPTAMPTQQVYDNGSPNQQAVEPVVTTGGAIIDNGLVQLGVHDQGHLNIPGPASSGGIPYVGLRYVPTNAEATAPGCLCEGWGIADAISGVSGSANEDYGISNITDLGFSSTASSAVSTVQVGTTFEVTHDYHPSPYTPNLYEVIVTVTNISGNATEVLYRRVMDWDIEPTAFAEYVTIQGTSGATNVVFASDNGFESADPLASQTFINFTGDAVDDGPTDHGALFDFNFGLLDPGQSMSFTTFYGAAGTETEALNALATVGAQVYSLGQPSTADGPTLGTPNTFIFGFTGVGGTPLCDPGDIPWASVAPTSGITPPAGETLVDVTLDSTGLTPGLYSGNLCIDSNDPDEPTVLVPLSLEVPPPPDVLVKIVPQHSQVWLGNQVTVDVVVEDVTDLYGVGLELGFDPAILQVVDADGGTAGVQITPGSCPSPDFIVQNAADNVTGTINYDASSLSPSLPCNGTGVVASITFEGIALGISPLGFNAVLLSDTNGVEIPSATQGGTIEVIIPPVGTIDGYVDLQGRSDDSGAEVCAWDGAVQVACDLTDASGYYMVEVPEGTYDVTVEIARYLDSEKAGVSVTAGSTTTLSTLLLPGGDANDDDIINILDLSFMGARYGCSIADPCYDPKADINNDTLINIQDIVLAGGNYLETSPVPWP